MTATVALNRMLRRQPIADLLAILLDGDRYEIDRDVLRIGCTSPHDPVHQVEIDGRPIATVAGHHAEQVAGALSAVATLEAERRMLADEVLGLYREVNLLYALADRLAGAIDSSELAHRIHAEATRLVRADAAVVVIDGAARPLNRFGQSDHPLMPVDLRRASTATTGDWSRLVAPMIADDTECGAIVLGRAGAAFTAGDLKLVSTVAGQGAALVDRVLEGERRQAAADRREQRLHEQIEQLRVELDATRRESDRTDAPGSHVPELRARIDALRQIVAASGETEVE